MNRVRTKFDFGLIILMAFYLLSYFISIVEFLDYLPYIRLYRGIMLVGVELYLAYFYLLLFPSHIMPRKYDIGAALSLFAIILVCNILPSVTVFYFVAELLIITLLAIGSLRMNLRIRLVLSHIKLSDENLNRHKLYKSMDMNTLNALLFTAMLIAVIFVGHYLITIVYSVITVAIIGLSTIEAIIRDSVKIFGLRYYIVSLISLIASFTLALLFSKWDMKGLIYLCILGCAIPFYAVSCLIWRGYHNFLYK